MTIEQFKKVKSESELSSDILKALWNDIQGEWERAHEIVQKGEGSSDYDRIHAYLHRKEGDKFNAQWWYRRIGLPYPTVPLEKEWVDLFIKYS